MQVANNVCLSYFSRKMMKCTTIRDTVIVMYDSYIHLHSATFLRFQLQCTQYRKTVLCPGKIYIRQEYLKWPYSLSETINYYNTLIDSHKMYTLPFKKYLLNLTQKCPISTFKIFYICIMNRNMTKWKCIYIFFVIPRTSFLGDWEVLFCYFPIQCL